MCYRTWNFSTNDTHFLYFRDLIPHAFWYLWNLYNTAVVQIHVTHLIFVLEIGAALCILPLHLVYSPCTFSLKERGLTFSDTLLSIFQIFSLRKYNIFGMKGFNAEEWWVGCRFTKWPCSWEWQGLQNTSVENRVLFLLLFILSLFWEVEFLCRDTRCLQKLGSSLPGCLSSLLGEASK